MIIEQNEVKDMISIAQPTNIPENTKILKYKIYNPFYIPIIGLTKGKKIR
jgi:hypothetical protein